MLPSCVYRSVVHYFIPERVGTRATAALRAVDCQPRGGIVQCNRGKALDSQLKGFDPHAHEWVGSTTE